MKILRRNNDFKKVPDNNINDAVTIKALIEQGWKYCSKSEFKSFTKPEKIEKVEPVEIEKIETKVTKKHGKNK